MISINFLFRNKVLILLFLLPFFNINSFKYIPSLTNLYDYIQWYKYIVIFVIIIIYLYSQKISKIVIFIIMYHFIIIFSSLINEDADVKYILIESAVVIAISMFTDLSLRYNINEYLYILFIIQYILLIFNFISIILYPQGLPMATLNFNTENPLYLLGLDNVLIRSILPVLGIISYFKVNNKNFLTNKTINIYFYSTIIISIISYIIVDSAAGLITVLFFILSIIVVIIIKNNKLPFKMMSILYLTVWYVVVYSGWNLSYISYFNTLFDRASTFTGRSTLWELAVELINEKPILGYGQNHGIINVWGATPRAHNMLLEILIHGGISAFVWFLFIVVKSIILGAYNIKTSHFNVLFITIFSYFIAGLVESGIPFIFYIFIVLLTYKNIKKQDINYNLKKD